jgi:hypothetical protein
LLPEKGQVGHQLDNTPVDLQGKEKQVAELQDILTQENIFHNLWENMQTYKSWLTDDTKKPMRRPRHRWKGNIRMGLKTNRVGSNRLDLSGSE